jgi:nitrogen regulatory protein PII
MILRVTAYVRPHRLEQVKTAVANLGVTGLTVTDVRGCGSSPERPSTFGGQDVLVALPVRSKLEVIVDEAFLEGLIAAISDNARTGLPGDGKVFVEPIVDAVRIRTGERGPAAV